MLRQTSDLVLQLRILLVAHFIGFSEHADPLLQVTQLLCFVLFDGGIAFSLAW